MKWNWQNMYYYNLWQNYSTFCPTLYGLPEDFKFLTMEYNSCVGVKQINEKTALINDSLLAKHKNKFKFLDFFHK